MLVNAPRKSSLTRINCSSRVGKQSRLSKSHFDFACCGEISTSHIPFTDYIHNTVHVISSKDASSLFVFLVSVFYMP